jgi:Holliday junction resolvase
MSRTTSAKAKGRAWETQIAEFLKANNIDCERRVKSGAKDKGDILIYANPTFVIEAKSERTITLASYMEELKVEIENAGGDRGVAVVKRVRKPVEEAYVVMPLGLFVEKYYGQ